MKLLLHPERLKRRLLAAEALAAVTALLVCLIISPMVTSAQEELVPVVKRGNNAAVDTSTSQFEPTSLRNVQIKEAVCRFVNFAPQCRSMTKSLQSVSNFKVS